MKNLKKNWIFLFMFSVTVILENSRPYKAGELSIVLAVLILWVVLLLKLISVFMYLIEAEKRQKKKKPLLEQRRINS